MTDEQISGSLMPQTDLVGVRRRRLGDIFSIQEKVPGGVRGSEFKIFYRKSYLETWEGQRLGYIIQKATTNKTHENIENDRITVYKV